MSSLAYGIVLRLLGPSPATAECGYSWAVGCLWVRLGFFFLEFCEVSVLSLGVHCWGGEFSYGLHIGGGFFWFILFRPLRSSVVSTHSTGRFGVGQGQRALAQGMRDGLEVEVFPVFERSAYGSLYLFFFSFFSFFFESCDY